VVISANAIQMAPANLAVTLTATSLATAGTGTFTLLKIMTATKIKLGVSAILVACAATALVLQHQAQEKLRGENEALQQQIAQLQTDSASLSNQLANAGGSSKLTDDQFNELLKLRGEVGVLRRQTNELGELENENRRLNEQMNAAQNPALTEEQEKEQAIQKLNDAKGYVLGFIMYANDHNGQLPTNWDQISPYTNKFQNVSGTNDFEIVNQGGINENAFETNAHSIMLIKSAAWLSSEGNWVKAYGFVDGHAQINKEPPEGFDAYEQQHMAATPNQ
jgi:hypothetical protein